MCQLMRYLYCSILKLFNLYRDKPAFTYKGNRIQEPKCICKSGYYDDLINEDCQQCDSICLECNINGCLSCHANRILNEEMDCIPPPNSMWYDNTPWCSTCQVAVYLSDDISKIIIHFDFQLNSKGFNTYCQHTLILLQFEINKCLYKSNTQL